jgi:hypothetical protein
MGRGAESKPGRVYCSLVSTFVYELELLLGRPSSVSDSNAQTKVVSHADPEGSHPVYGGSSDSRNSYQEPVECKAGDREPRLTGAAQGNDLGDGSISRPCMRTRQRYNSPITTTESPSRNSRRLSDKRQGTGIGRRSGGRPGQPKRQWTVQGARQGWNEVTAEFRHG